MILHTEQLRQKAHDLALIHDACKKPWSARRLWREVAADIRSLRSFIALLQQDRTDCAQPAEEWLLDHAEFIEDQILAVRQQLSGDLLRDLPVLRHTGENRLLAVCNDYLEHVDGNLDEEGFLSYLNFYQEVAVLTIAETWAVPLVLRLALIRRLASVMQTVRQRREVCKLVEGLLARINPAHLNPETLNKALEEAGQEMPLSGLLIVQLVRHLRELAEDTSTLQQWLLCKLENGPDSLDQIVSYEYQLQAAYQATTGNLIGSLRRVARWDWRQRFEQICLVEQTLRQESAGVYPLLDFASRDLLRRQVQKLARRMRVPENLVAKQAVELAAQAHESCCRGEAGEATGAGPAVAELPRRAFAPYYLLESAGINELRAALQVCGKIGRWPVRGMTSQAVGNYFTMLLVLWAVFLALPALWIGRDTDSLPWLPIVLALALPASEWAVTAAHLLIECCRPPRPLLRYDFAAAIPPEATSMVVIPVIWSSVEEVEEIADRLELHYLANRHSNLHFALLGDLTDARAARLPGDAAVLSAARVAIEELNRKYAGSGHNTFHLFQRRRQWNPAQGVWMGWERKRGALVEFVELLRGRNTDGYELVVGDASVLPRIRYVITLDADTQLPMGSAWRMIGTLHLPYNRPRLNAAGTRVVEGYGVLQPRIGVSYRSAMASRFAWLWSADPGVDPYAFAVSDPYQDGLGQGIFTGKGIFDVAVFDRVLCERIPENRVLSHDLLEGGFLRTGLLTDIELVDEQPATFSAYQKRLHRWVRGDWQLLPWLGRRVADRRGRPQPVDLSPLTRWQMIDNLRRSMLPPALFAVLLLGLTVLPGAPGRWLAVALATLCLPLVRQLLAVRRTLWRPRSTLATAGQVLLNLVTLPFQSALLLDAIGRTLYRLLVSKRQLLEWVSAAEVERRSRGGRYPVLLGMWGGYLLIILFGMAVVGSGPALPGAGLLLVGMWAAAPLVVRWLDRPLQVAEQPLSQSDEAALRQLAQEIWAFFEDYVTAADHWLPPDNLQLEPPNGVAHRTSPTNIGLYLACVLAARDFGFIDMPGLIERVERTVGTIEQMDKWHGHLYNWYDTQTLEPLPPLYVSTVDSGNLVGCLIVVKEGLAEWLEQLNAAQAAGDQGAGQMSAGAEAAWPARARQLWHRLSKLIEETDFRPLYDHKTNLFNLGYHAALERRDQVLYDLLASEARLASFIAIALGQVPVTHWHALGRTLTRIGRQVSLLSWSGTMFEYLMPWLFMRTYPHSIWDSTYRAVVRRQIDYAAGRGVPFGISESGYYAFDYQMNYQYRAFGVPGLGFKRGLEQDLVVAPYATIMALPFDRAAAMASLSKLAELGARGQYGFYEAVDFTVQRLPKNRTAVVIRSFMAHHQGMSLLTLANLLLPRTIYHRFHRDKRVRAAELLLQERIPVRPRIVKHPALAWVPLPDHEPEARGRQREYLTADTPAPEVCILSNGEFMTVVTNSGSGFSSCRGLAVTRWREDPVLDNWGSYLYIRDVTRDAVWSPTFHPCRVPASQQRAQFALDRATFMRVDNDIETSLEICVSPEWPAEVRRLTLTNTGDEERLLEVTTYLEPVLAPWLADEAHPAFSKLFIHTEYDEAGQTLLARRRPRQTGEKAVWAAHSLLALAPDSGPVEYETDRAAFIGRGHSLALPQGLGSRLRGTVGSVADPALIMRRRISIQPGRQVQLCAVTAMADSRQAALDIISRFAGDLVVERTFQMAWHRSQIELRHLHLTPEEALAWHELAGQVLYTPPFKPERQSGIAHNEKGQSGLWSYGISGDLPLVLVRVKERAGLPLVAKMLAGHQYLRRLGLLFDLVLLNESSGGYRQDLQEALQRAAEHVIRWQGAGSGGVFILKQDRLTAADRTLLLATARLTLRAEGPGIKGQTRLPRRPAAPPPLVPTAPPHRFAHLTAPVQLPPLEFFNGWGGFTPDGREYLLLLKNSRQLPAPWINVLANPNFGCLVSERGTGYTWWRNSRECKITPWSNDPVLDPPGEICYLRDEESGEHWCVTGSTHPSDPDYLVTHGRGYTCFQHTRHGIRQDLTVFVPPADPVKVMQLQLHNLSQQPRHLSITYYAEWVLGVRRPASAPYIITCWDESARILLARNAYQEAFREANAFLGLFVQPEGATDEPAELSWTADRQEFLGRNGTPAQPAALTREKLSGLTGPLYDPCGAVQAKLTLAPGASRTVIILLGCHSSQPAAVQLAQQYSRAAACRQALQQVQQFWTEVLEQVSVTTPVPAMNILMNGWLLYQALGCRMWARSAFYQAGGAYGFRDQLQDSLALLHSRPDLTRAQILLHAAHQYEEGDVQHWWHEETRRGIRTQFSDDLLWLPYAAARYIEHTGDHAILDERVPFLHSQPLQEGEHERYEPTQVSEQEGSLLEHCLRALDRSLQRFGEHGLPLIGIGDWNDGMSLVGAAGRGESVWLGWFLYEVLQHFSRLCQEKGHRERAHRYRAVSRQLASALDRHAWDGQWYRRAFTDAGQWLGSVYNQECRIDAIAQSWSVLSGGAPPDKARQAMESFDRELVDRELSLACLLTPPFDRTEPSPGYIQGYPPGIRENGAQYTHGVIWSIVAWCRLGQGDKAFELFDMLNPLNHTRTSHEVLRYAGEPYVMAADVYTAEPHRGRAGWTWYTGAAGWMFQAGLEWILGLRRRGGRLYIDPCIPGEWPQFSVTYRFGNTRYLITVQNPSGKGRGPVSLEVDGRPTHLTEQGEARVDLQDDGQQHTVIVTL